MKTVLAIAAVIVTVGCDDGRQNRQDCEASGGRYDTSYVMVAGRFPGKLHECEISG